MKKKLLTILLSVFMIMGVFANVVHANTDTKTVAEILHDFPETEETAWVNESGAILYRFKNKDLDNLLFFFSNNTHFNINTKYELSASENNTFVYKYGENVTVTFYSDGNSNIKSIKFKGIQNALEGTYTADVAMIGETRYKTLQEAIEAAENNQTVSLLKDCSEGVEATSLIKSITIDGKDFKMTGKLKLIGNNDNDITIKNFNFETSGLDLKNFNDVIIDNNTFTSITTQNQYDYYDALVVTEAETATITNNTINGADEVGIDCRDIKTAVTITGNTVKNTKHNSIQVVKANKAYTPNTTITNNTLENWGCAPKPGKSVAEGRALRADLLNEILFTGNIMKNDNAPEEFVKITNCDKKIDVSHNYWGGNDPNAESIYIGQAEDRRDEIVSYYADDKKQTLLDYYVAKVGDDKYILLKKAFKNANNKTVTLLKDNVVTERIEVNDNEKITLDLNGHKISTTSEFSNGASGILLVRNGGSLTIDDLSNEKTGKVTTEGTGVYAAVALTKKGDTDFSKPATLIVNNGKLEGNYYAITGNGSRQNTITIINGGTIKGIKENESAGIYHPQQGILTVNGGTIEGAVGIYAKSGEVTTSITGGTIKATGNKGTYITKSDGFEITGDALILDNCDYPGGEPNAIIRGGYFYNTAVEAYSIASYAATGKEPITKFIKGGYFVTLPNADYICDGFEAKNVDPASTEFTNGYKYYVAAIAEEAHNIKEEEVNGVNTVTESYVVGTVVETAFGLDKATNTSDVIDEVIENNTDAKNIEVEVVLNAKAVELATNTDAQSINEKLDNTKGQTIENYLDLTVNQIVKIDGVKNNTYSKTITETDSYQYITVKVSDTLKSKLDKIIVIRKHGDDVKTLTKAASESDANIFNGPCYYITGNETDGYYIVIKTKEFSVYAIGFQSTAVSEYKYVAPGSEPRYKAPNTGIN